MIDATEQKPDYVIKAEVLLYNKKDLKRQLDNEERQQGKEKTIKKDTRNLE